MDLLIKDSGLVCDIVVDSLTKVIGNEEGVRIYNTMIAGDESTKNLLHHLNEALVRAGYATKIKNVFDRITEGLSSRIDVKIFPDHIDLKPGASENVSVDITNRFDVPLVFDVAVEDRDSFLPIVYNKIEGAYFNNFSMESIIDSGVPQKFRFKIGSENGQKSKGTTLFVVIRSKEIEGLNWVGKLKVDFFTGD